MKINLTFLLIISILTCSAQSSKYVGEYYMKKDNNGMSQQYTLILNENGTFLFNQYWKQSKRFLKNHDEVQSTGNEKGKGRWIYKDEAVLFLSDSKSDIEQNHRLNFNNSKAKLENNSDLVFLESGLFWLENLMLEKK